MPQVQLGSEEWHSLRVGTVTASKLQRLFCLFGHKEFNPDWLCIHNNVDERKVAPKKFKNFSWGIKFEGRAIKLFEDLCVYVFAQNGYSQIILGKQEILQLNHFM